MLSKAIGSQTKGSPPVFHQRPSPMMSRLAIVLNLLAVVMIGFALMMLLPLGVSLALEYRVAGRRRRERELDLPVTGTSILMRCRRSMRKHR